MYGVGQAARSLKRKKKVQWGARLKQAWRGASVSQSGTEMLLLLEPSKRVLKAVLAKAAAAMMMISSGWHSKAPQATCPAARGRQHESVWEPQSERGDAGACAHLLDLPALTLDLAVPLTFFLLPLISLAILRPVLASFSTILSY